MTQCAACGNEYDKTFQIIMDGNTYDFDCFECAMSKLAPECAQCGIRIIGHGLENGGTYYCCDNCAEKAGVTGLADRA